MSETPKRERIIVPVYSHVLPGNCHNMCDYLPCLLAGLVTLEEMKEKQETLVKAREKQIAAQHSSNDAYVYLYYRYILV